MKVKCLVHSFPLSHGCAFQASFLFFSVIALKGVPYKSGQIRFLAKNGCWVSCITEWSSFVNPWSKRLEFIIGKHSVVKLVNDIIITSIGQIKGDNSYYPCNIKYCSSLFKGSNSLIFS